jgi:hypothetical protein
LAAPFNGEEIFVMIEQQTAFIGLAGRGINSCAIAGAMVILYTVLPTCRKGYWGLLMICASSKELYILVKHLLADMLLHGVDVIQRILRIIR